MVTLHNIKIDVLARRCCRQNDCSASFWRKWLCKSKGCQEACRDEKASLPASGVELHHLSTESSASPTTTASTTENVNELGAKTADVSADFSAESSADSSADSTTNDKDSDSESSSTDSMTEKGTMHQQRRPGAAANGLAWRREQLDERAWAHAGHRRLRVHHTGRHEHNYLLGLSERVFGPLKDRPALYGDS